MNENRHEDSHLSESAHRYPLFFGAEGLRAGWGLLLYLAMLAAFFSITHFITAHVHHTPPGPSVSTATHEESPRRVIFREAIPFFLIAMASWIMSRIERRPAGSYGLGGSRKLPHFLAGLGWGVGFLSLLVLILKLTGLLLFDGRLLRGVDILRYGAIWAIGFLFVALLEEYLLRGYLQFTLSRGFASIYEAVYAHRPDNRRNSDALGFWTAAFLLSFLFGFSHSSNHGESPIGLLAAGAIGIVFCLSLWRTGSLWWAIGFHTAWDWAESYLYGVADSGSMVQFHLFATHPTGKPLWSGGATGPEGSIFVLLIVVLIAGVILLMLPKTPYPAQDN